MTTHIFNVTRVNRLTGSIVPLIKVSLPARVFLADTSIIHHSYRNCVDYHKKHRKMKKIKAKSSKASQASLALERARVKSQFKPFSGSELLGRYVETVFDSGGKIWLVSSK